MPKDARAVRFSMGGTMTFSTFEEVAACARTFEELGISTFYASDHMFGVGLSPLETPVMEPWTLITGLAAVTKRLRFGVLVSGVTYRHPSMVAKIASTLDVISHGRLDLGIGGAWSKDDHVAFGIDFPALKERQARLREAVEILDGLLSRPRFSYKGQYYHLQDAFCLPGPVQKPRPPILLAAVGDSGVDLAARYAQTWCAVATPPFAKERIARLQAKAREAGRDPKEIECAVFIALHLSDDAAAVRRDLDQRISRMAVTAGQKRTVFAQVRNCLPEESPQERLRAQILAGNGAQIAEQVHRFVEAGVTHIIVMTPRPFDRRIIEKFHKEVMTPFVGN
jgi:alkanesulfonate monooxygenase SsuD/methylene tetrahydromethanopterin reductase-like flavin-dependent oxidoreductase (luciferase family)